MLEPPWVRGTRTQGDLRWSAIQVSVASRSVGLQRTSWQGGIFAVVQDWRSRWQGQGGQRVGIVGTETSGGHR